MFNRIFSPPPSIPSIETGTPPKEWSESVLASSPSQTNPAASQDTPGRADDPATIEGEPLGSKQHVSSEEHREPRISLPSTELRGAQPSEHSGGIGALPGNLSESSVALLPDERSESVQEHPPSSSRQRRDTIKPLTSVGGDETQPTEETKIPAASQPSDVPPKRMGATESETVNITEAKSSDVVPQKESGGANREAVSQRDAEGTADGATELPSHAEELSRKQKDAEGSNLASEELGVREGASQDVKGDAKEEKKTETAKKVEGGYGDDYHPAQLHPPPPGASVAEYRSSIGTQQGESLEVTPKQEAEVVAEKKPKFMAMVKGEMKILAGKMSGDEHKVEEGKKIVHGGA